ncbi:MAG: AraC family transcriptional regulator [Ferruginibacter sp.]|nr:AraC family transcriptional regulator [Ferruginibacter sp.]
MQPHRLKSISEYHAFRGLPKPEHPLVSVINIEEIKKIRDDEPASIIQDFYSIALKKNVNCVMHYGQQEYDFDEGVMIFISPGQVYSIQGNAAFTHTGWLLLVHPDFFWNSALAKTIRHYEYFGYSVTEALYLSEKEEGIITGVLRNIQQEYHGNIDKFSQPVIIAHLELLLSYADRFYHRQFLTRKITNHKILSRLEKLLTEHFNSDDLVEKGLPTVQAIAQTLHVSPNYLSGLLTVLTGQSTQQHIHNKLIEKAKEKLSITSLSISEIAYELGFEHSQSFSKLFKTKTAFSPLEYRKSFQ